MVQLRNFWLIGCSLLLLVLGSCTEEGREAPPADANPNTVNSMEEAVSQLGRGSDIGGKEFRTFKRLIDDFGLTSELYNPNATNTVFAPDDSAFARLLRTLRNGYGNQRISLEDLNPNGLLAILRNHVVANQRLTYTGITDQQAVTTRVGDSLIFGVQGAGNARLVTISYAPGSNDSLLFTQIDNPADDLDGINAINGVIHQVEAVMVPTIVRDTIGFLQDQTGGGNDTTDTGSVAQPTGELMLDAMAAENELNLFVALINRYDNVEGANRFQDIFNDSTDRLTVFAPNNQAMRDYFQAENKGGLEDYTDTEILNFRTFIEAHYSIGVDDNGDYPEPGITLDEYENPLTLASGPNTSVILNDLVTPPIARYVAGQIEKEADIVTPDQDALNGVYHIIGATLVDPE